MKEQEIFKKVFDRIKPLETLECMYSLSAQTIRDIINLVIDEVKQ